jgi:hypothetical protein
MSIVRTVVIVMLAGTTLLRAQSTPPLPDPQPFFDAVRRNLTRSQDDQKLFGYKERRTNVNLNPFGRLGTNGTRLIEVTPTRDGAQLRRVLERDGVPVPDSQPNRRENRMPQGRTVVEDVARVLEIEISHREMLEGRPAIVVRFQARPDAKPRTREGRIARAFTGLIWVDESAHEVRRIEATAIDDITFGYGMLARVNEGSVVQVERRLVEGDAWLPTSMRFKGEGRALLFRKLVIDFAVEWFDYRRVL